MAQRASRAGGDRVQGQAAGTLATKQYLPGKANSPTVSLPEPIDVSVTQFPELESITLFVNLARQ